MQFYKYEGFVKDSKWAEENDDRLVLREKIGKIARKSDSFNQKLQKKGFFFVSDISEGAVTVGIVDSELGSADRYVSSFLKALAIEVSEGAIEEISFRQLERMLKDARHCHCIEDDEAILTAFNLQLLDSSYIRFGENMIDDTDKRSVYAKVHGFLADETFLPELDRIYAGSANRKAHGHPVHYYVQTDDHDTRKGMYRLLLSALYKSGRLQNRRYVYLDFKPADSIYTEVYDSLYQSCIGGAVVVRFLANEAEEDDQAVGDADLIETISQVAKKYHNRVLTVLCLPRECTKAKETFRESLGNLTFVELMEDLVTEDAGRKYLKGLAKKNGVCPDEKLLGAAESGKRYLPTELQTLFDAWYNEKLKSDVFPQYKDLLTGQKETKKAAPKGTAYAELTEMIGLSEAKKIIARALNYYKAQKLFADKGMNTERPSMHMAFTGNPGTAKTTVARLFARIMKENGLLSRGQLVEVGRGDLVGKYVGWTAKTVRKKFSEAQGGVLFIDEAYSLVDDRGGSYGDEAINTIVQEMENHRDDVAVIFAGYRDKMEEFLERNPGLRSRIAFHVPFADYSTEELCLIADAIAGKKGLELTEDAREKLRVLFDGAREQSDFGNGRFVRNVIERAGMAQAERLLNMDVDAVLPSDIRAITAVDVDEPFPEVKTVRRRIGFCA